MTPVLVAFDTETTGLEPGSRLIELAAVAFRPDGTVVDTFEALVDPGMPLPPDIFAISGISAAMLAGKPHAGDVLRRFSAWVPAQALLIAHNAPFDCGIVGWELLHAGLPMPTQRVLDTRLLAKALGETPDNRLQTLVQHHRWSLLGDPHRALPDADAVRQLYLHARRAARMPEATFAGDPFTAPHRPPKLPKALRCLPTAITEGRQVRLAYRDAKGTESERLLTPYGYAETDKGTYFHGLCHTAAARRTFSAGGVISMALEPAVARP